MKQAVDSPIQRIGLSLYGEGWKSAVGEFEVLGIFERDGLGLTAGTGSARRE